MLETEVEELLTQRVLILDGAMGTMIQSYGLSEEDYRGELFHDKTIPQKGNNDLLNMTKPEVIEAIHRSFLESGADILETNTFNANAISMEDYGMEDQVYAINKAGAEIAKRLTVEFTKANPDKPRFVAGSCGPTTKLASMSPDVNNPGHRAVDFNALVQAYTTQVNGLLDGGADLILIETITDTLNAKAAIFAIKEIEYERGTPIPIMISGTITDRSGRTLSGQTVEAFWNSVAHANPISIGLNCALGAELMEPFVERLSRVATCAISVHPNAGLPNEIGEYDESPAYMSNLLKQFGQKGLLNIVGGCCGTTPDHIQAIAHEVSSCKPRAIDLVEKTI